jgi:hypothetical protein
MHFQKTLLGLLTLLCVSVFFSFQKPTWGFFAHQRINRLAVFTLPPEISPFYKKHIEYLMEYSVAPDQRRYAVKDEAPRHFIDLDVYGDSAAWKMPHNWQEALQKYTEDTLLRHGIVPWHIGRMKAALTEAFRDNNARRILRISAEIGHYIADANVPLHTTRNYNGQFSGQDGIHGFWESRVPELLLYDFDFFVGKAEYLPAPAKRTWAAIAQAHVCVDSVLTFEKQLTKTLGENRKYVVEERNGQNIKTYSQEFTRQYNRLLDRQVERQMRSSIKMIGDFWYTAWIDAGQPDLSKFMNFSLDELMKKEEIQERKEWEARKYEAREEF